MDQTTTDPQVLTLPEVYRRLPAERKTGLCLIGTSQFPAYKMGAGWCIDAPDLKRFVANQKQVARHTGDAS